MAQVVRLVIRLIRSFKHKNIRSIVLRDDIDGFNLTTSTVQELMTLIRSKLTSSKISPPLPPPFKTFNFNCMKVCPCIIKQLGKCRSMIA